ncbi:uncharacterized protein [Mytilus edulis]
MAEGKGVEYLLEQLDNLSPPKLKHSNEQEVDRSTGKIDKSLEELMKDFTGQLDSLPPPKPASKPVEGDLQIKELPGLENLLNRVAENLEGTSICSGDQTTDSKGEAAEGGRKGIDTIEDMLKTLNKNIKSGDWLKENTAERWVQENPKLAEDYKKAAQHSPNS